MNVKHRKIIELLREVVGSKEIEQLLETSQVDKSEFYLLNPQLSIKVYLNSLNSEKELIINVQSNGKNGFIQYNKSVPLQEEEVTTSIPEAKGENPSQFPLGLVTGEHLRKANPLVKDVQKYCNKYGKTNIKVDGAFGKYTQAAVLKVFKTLTISKEQYNSIIAPSLGNPTVD